MNRRHATHHVIRINRTAYPQLRAAVAQGHLKATSEHLDVMEKGQVYCPAPSLLHSQMLVHDRLLHLGTLTITGEFYRMPEWEYTSIITSSQGSYHQYPDLFTLMTALLAPMTSAAEAIWWQKVRAAVAQGRWLTCTVDLVDDVWTPTAWQRDRTRLIERGGEWFMVLYFAQPPRLPMPRGRDVVGVDVGLHPLVTLASGRQHTVTWPVHGLTVPGGESAEVRILAQILTYASARAALEGITVPLLAQAGTLVLEKLDYVRFKSNFPDAARRHAVSDWHQSWAPQRAYSRGIEVVRVSPAFTSLTCSQCRAYTLGSRQGQTFTCPHGHAMDVHLNAARNLVRRFWGQRRRAPHRRAE
ncbi:zinc ribbon domain-containing protein [Deinococcus sp. QL22]|uniref:zinc ribbon domain-containing protein n=1 Tax=Deinococcus sp. QL22 TaxID=2939437 RepID=UPI00201794F9|nr:zinc ribbon domain-containing protein [Deinococcus sp. QL22]UQN06527.1 zinc ribbon domain-containing protein [Deinococcus sp. QL22]